MNQLKISDECVEVECDDCIAMVKNQRAGCSRGQLIEEIVELQCERTKYSREAGAWRIQANQYRDHASKIMKILKRRSGEKYLYRILYNEICEELLFDLANIE